MGAGTVAAALPSHGVTPPPATWPGHRSAQAARDSATPGTHTPTLTAAVLRGRSLTHGQSIIFCDRERSFKLQTPTKA